MARNYLVLNRLEKRSLDLPMARVVQFTESGMMLRISADEAVGEPIVLRLDGQISGRWVKLLRGTCEGWLKNGSGIVADLKNVSFADRDGIDLLRNLADRGVEILNALPFIFEQIRRTTP